jgi:D-glycero-D-manno-heptose 1,7-bisphosphate phosphatase
MSRQLEVEGARLDGIYFSTGVPRSVNRAVVEDPDRKPGPGMLLRAARELGLDLSRSWMIGDMISDVLAGRNAGCTATILINGRHRCDSGDAWRAADAHCDSLLDAARIVAASVSLQGSDIGVDIEIGKEVECTKTRITNAS